jgi:hypothetical protein
MPEEDFIVLSSSNSHHKKDFIGQQTEMPQIEFDPMSAYWFRWVTGHQVVFIFWHLLGKELAYMETTGLDGARLDCCSRILQGGALIFEYAGSCSQEYYHKYVRPFMALAHKGFSGRWSLDYEPLPQLVKRIMQANVNDLLLKKYHLFKKSYSLHQRLHYRVAKRLVPEGGSLLQKGKNEGTALDEVQKHHYMRSDFFFLVDRTAVSCEQLEHTLWRRINAIQMDLHSHPLPELPFITDNHLDILQRAAEAVSEVLQMMQSSSSKT